MGKRQGLPVDKTRVFLVLELAQVRSPGPEGIELIISRPGVEGAFTRAWRAPGGSIDAAQAGDLTAYVERVVSESLMTWIGVQGVITAP